MSLRYNERLKYLGTALNGVAVACITTGFIAPLAAFTFGMTSLGAIGPTAIASSLVWLSVGVGLHLIVQAVLGKLKE